MNNSSEIPYSEIKEKNDNEESILGSRVFSEDVQLIKYLSEVALEKNEFSFYLKKELFKSRRKEIDNIEKDNKLVNAASNAISILVYADISFARMDLTEIRIRGADITDGIFNGCDFSGSDLTSVVLENCQLDNAILRGTNMTDVKLGKPLNMDVGSIVHCVAFSPDGNMIIIASADKMIR